MRFLHWTLATWWGSGLSPKAPGTMGSLASLPFVYLWMYAFPQPILTWGAWSLQWIAVGAVLLFLGSIYSVNQVIQDSGKKDPQMVVVDETVGQWMAFALIPSATLWAYPWIILLGFALFRFFDITKILGIHRLEKLPRAWGVMADDLLGGIYAAGVLGVVVWGVY